MDHVFLQCLFFFGIEESLPNSLRPEEPSKAHFLLAPHMHLGHYINVLKVLNVTYCCLSRRFCDKQHENCLGPTVIWTGDGIQYQWWLRPIGYTVSGVFSIFCEFMLL